MPSSSLPFDVLSRVVAILASNAGFLKELQVTIVPNLIVSVTVEMAERVVQHSRIGVFSSIR